MDYYVKRFTTFYPEMTVADYVVYLESKTGLARLNPFASTEQMVLYWTDQGEYVCRISNNGAFTQPSPFVKAKLDFHDNYRFAVSRIDAKRFRYLRKWKQGRAGSLPEFMMFFFNGQISC